VNSRIPPPFANRLSGASANSAGDGRSSPAPSLCGPQSSRYIHRVDTRRACGVAPQGAPVHAHEVPIAAAVVMKPPSLPLLCRRRSPSPPFSRSLSCSSSLSLSRALARVSSLPLPLLSIPLASVLYSRSFSLSPFSHARLPLTRVLPLSLSLFAHARLPSRVFSLFLSPSLSLPLVLVATQGPPTSPAVPCPARRTQCHRSAPSAGRPSASHRVRRATSRRFPAPRGITPPRWEQIGSTPATIYPRVLGQRPSCAGLGVRRCNTREGSRVCCNRSRKRPAPRRKGSQRQSVEGREASCWAQRRCRAAEGDDEVGAVCRGLPDFTWLLHAMRTIGNW